MDEIPPSPPPINNELESISSTPSPVIIPTELIALILSFLPVKIISKFRCVSKSWKKLISDPSFIQMHLQKSSSLNPNFIFKPFVYEYPFNTIVSLPISRLLHNQPSITLSGHTYRNLLKDDENCFVVGSCNGLICLRFESHSTKHVNFSFRIWNPATGTISEKLGFLRENKPILGIFKFTFGCDVLTGTYKLVWLHSVQIRGIWKTNVRVYSLGGNGDGDDKCCWRNISTRFICGDGVHLNGTITWLTLSEDLSVLGGSVKPLTPHVDFFRIASLDLSTETFTELFHPEDFNEVPCAESNLRVLLDCLCFSHDFRKTEFVIWQMKEFGVRESWTQLFRIRYFDLQMPNVPIEVQYLDESTLMPLYVSKNGDTVILTNEEDDKAIIYNQRDNRVVRTTTSNNIQWFSAIDYTESLVPTPWKPGDVEAKTKQDEDESESEDEEEEVYGGFFFTMIN
ncbi:hypothetical protein TSUD_143660 [Trifolium subterraneum]|uniref:F-box domain-containing protein n=1 Tax=Trifolium subterraneum TaxID=3900 RepID=A0A2Z6MGC1_TRISU|nr:hypothetical protein TSUD_143660 [Trifolium subterraneum]